jgi:hypothetical protein
MCSLVHVLLENMRVDLLLALVEKHEKESSSKSMKKDL